MYPSYYQFDYIRYAKLAGHGPFLTGVSFRFLAGHLPEDCHFFILNSGHKAFIEYPTGQTIDFDLRELDAYMDLFESELSPVEKLLML